MEEDSWDSTESRSFVAFTDGRLETTTTNNNNNPLIDLDPSPSEPKHDTIDDKSSGEALGKGLSALLATLIRDFDSKAQATLKSQDLLHSAIDRLTRELDQLLEDAPLPFIMQHAAKISGVKKRVSSLNSVLKSIERRVDNIDRILSVGMLQEKTTTQIP